MFLAEDELETVSQLVLPVCAAERSGACVDRLLVNSGAFAAAVLDGVVAHRMGLGAQTGLRLLAPGDIVLRAAAAPAGALECSSYEAVGATQLALLDDKLLFAARSVPRLLAGLLLHLDQQNQRLATQVMICQLQRVEDRVLAMMWQLADSWGRVTPAGTMLAIRLTHQALGELVGARRPTVTLALKQLADRGALRRQKLGWLLLERPAAGLDEAPIKPSYSPLATRISSSLPELDARVTRMVGAINKAESA